MLDPYLKKKNDMNETMQLALAFFDSVLSKPASILVLHALYQAILAFYTHSWEAHIPKAHFKWNLLQPIFNYILIKQS